MNEYLLKLFKQFNESLGITITDYSDQQYIESFKYWLTELEINSKKYQEFLSFIGIDIDSVDTIELRKGKYDSIALPNTTIISPFGKTLGKSKSNIVLINENPVIINENKHQIIECPNGIYITQNPYDINYLSGIPQLSMEGKNYCIGVFGSIYDSDKEKKLKQLSDYKEIYLPSSKEEYEIIDDTYLYTIKKEPLKRVRVKSKY